MTKYYLLTTALFSLILFSLNAQVITVQEKDTEVPLPGVLVFGEEPHLSKITDKYGRVDLSGFSNASKIHFQLLGYESKSTDLETISDSSSIVFLVPGLIQMEQAVITASRWRQSDQETPNKISVFNQEALQLRSPSNTADWLGSNGDVFIQKSQQGGGSPMIRGFSANRLLYSVDGVRVNTAIFRGGNLQNVISLDPLALQNTEVLFGPGSVMYGSDALGGVMAFETLKPNFSDSGIEVKGTFFSRFATANKEKTFHGDISFATKKWAFLSSASHFDYGDLEMGNKGPEDYLRPWYVIPSKDGDQSILNPNPDVQKQSGYSQLNLMQKVRYKPSNRTTWDYAFHYSKSSDIPRYDRLIEGSYEKPKYAEWKYGPQVWLMNQLSVSQLGRGKLYDQMSIKLAQQHFEESRINRRFNNPTLTDRVEKVNALSINADWVKTLFKENFLSYGAEIVYNSVNSSGTEQNIQNNEELPASARYPKSDWTSLAIYSTYHAHISDQLKFQGGLRFNQVLLSADFSSNEEFFPLPYQETTNNNGALTGSAGLVYNPSSSFTISPQVSTGFRAPNVDDLGKFFDSEPGAVIVPNPDLKPEYVYNAEVNLNKHWGNFLKVDASVYYTFLDRAMVRRPFELGGQDTIIYEGVPSKVLAIQNAASARVYGLQAGLEWSPSKNWLLYSKLNWQKGEEELEDETTSPTRHAAPLFGLTRITYSTKRLKVELSSNYSGEISFEDMPVDEKGKPHLYAKDENGNPYSPSWMTINLHSTYQLTGFLDLMLGIENIGDKRYRPYSSGMAGPGRNFSFSIKASF
ncbi:TonB-dependent receptor plug domain-containing protein [Algoriphagus machipongonensis]|uniref:TonB-dependent receptor n=1 Tax=Algoriphagus machipongonensis TaxID=388413 RepID=A3I333_9BACT|nr:TonB-dependent receptor [Algoriphagus machipongonensis]EAZ79232.1 putative TonB-dependent receptor [Algoriphagus machipongonensis]